MSVTLLVIFASISASIAASINIQATKDSSATKEKLDIIDSEEPSLDKDLDND